MSCNLLREGALRKRCVFLPSMGFLLQPAGINRPSGLAVCLDFSVWTPIRFSLPGFFSVSTSWDATLPLKQLPSSEMFWIVACFTPKQEPYTRMWGDPRNAKQVKRGEGSCGLWAAVVTSAFEYTICSGFANGCACRRSLMRLSRRKCLVVSRSQSPIKKSFTITICH